MTAERPVDRDERDMPNWELIRRAGWSLGSVSGRYCVAWRGRTEAVFVWQDGHWREVATGGPLRDAG